MLCTATLILKTTYFSLLIVVTIGFVETLIEVNETDGTAALNVSIRSPSDVAFGFEIILLVTTVDGSASM